MGGTEALVVKNNFGPNDDASTAYSIEAEESDADENVDLVFNDEVAELRDISIHDIASSELLEVGPWPKCRREPVKRRVKTRQSRSPAPADELARAGQTRCLDVTTTPA